MNFRAELVGAFGDPIAENPTGVMQEAAFAAADLNWRYLMLDVKAEALADAIAGAKAFGMRGFNLTIPHKVAVIDYLDEVSPSVEVIGAVNTVTCKGGRLIGDNTDGKGFMRGIENAAFDPKGKRVVMLGAGGAARAAAAELLLAGVANLLVVNRTLKRGATMVDDLKTKTRGPIRFEAWEGTFPVPVDTDLLVNATSIGLHPNVEEQPDVDLSAAQPAMLVCDVVINPPETRFLRTAKEQGFAVLDGLTMLVYQGVIAFQLWTGQDPDPVVMREAIRDALGVQR